MRADFSKFEQIQGAYIACSDSILAGKKESNSCYLMHKSCNCWHIKGTKMNTIPNPSTKLKAILKERGVSVAELSRGTGIPYKTVSRMVNSETLTGGLKTWYEICSYLEINLSELF